MQDQSTDNNTFNANLEVDPANTIQPNVAPLVQISEICADPGNTSSDKEGSGTPSEIEFYEGFSEQYGKKIRRFIHTFINTNDLPGNKLGTWNTSVLEDEDLATEIKEHLQTKGKYMKANDIVDYLQDPEVKNHFKLDKVPALSTAQHWLKELGFRWTTNPKGQYVDGHEREDVKRMRSCDSKTMQEYIPRLEPGERLVMVWFHDESIFYANDIRLTWWVYFEEDATPFAKGEGASIMVADFVSIDGWLSGSNLDENAQIVMFPGKAWDGYLTNEWIRTQLVEAIRIAKAKYPEAEHVFIYDNTTTHTKRCEGALSAVKMTLGPLKNFGDVVGTDPSGQKIHIRMEDAILPNGSQQPLYFPDDHPKYPGYFKGISEMLHERGVNATGLKLQCPPSNCDTKNTACCACRLLFNQPDFTHHRSALEEIAESHGCQVVLLLKFHCELNPIKQCWGFAKCVYRQFTASKLESDLKANMLAALNSVPLDSIRRFFNKSQRYADAYMRGLDGREAVWANKKYQGHQVLPASIMEEVEAEFRSKKAFLTVVQM
ncbi:hypothetical protein BDV93DRAFT_534597 [Ceratobasidium sp. AG-I]|nr:hypothetical protein BDV93DRAFT_534597 [Ceratobasidium sp. AG-I]